MTPLFDLGQVEISEQAAALPSLSASLPDLLKKHQSGDWHAEGERAQTHNEFAAQHGLLVAAEYALSDGSMIMLVTAQDRSRTRVLLPDEFKYMDIGLNEGYARWASRYDTWKNPLVAVEEPLVTQLLQALSFQTVLDVGVGTGRYALRLAEQGAWVVGLDLSPEMLTVAKSKTALSGHAPAFLRATLEDPFPVVRGRFDLVLCSLALSHVTNLRACLQEFARMQTTHGICLISEFHPEAIMARWRPSLQEPEGVYRLPNWPHTRDDYLDGLRAVGYHVQQVFDLRVADVPDGYFDPALVTEHGSRGLCLVVLAERGASSDAAGKDEG
jgi:ubiquinone/menaquinone biosynthesis C-methylase UbiE